MQRLCLLRGWGGGKAGDLGVYLGGMLAEPALRGLLGWRHSSGLRAGGPWLGGSTVRGHPRLLLQLPRQLPKQTRLLDIEVAVGCRLAAAVVGWWLRWRPWLLHSWSPSRGTHHRAGLWS